MIPALRVPSPQLQAWLRARIAEQTGPGAVKDWPREVMRTHGVLLVDGNAACLWFLAPDGGLWSVDTDSVAHRLEPERDPVTVREVLARAARELPELQELLASPPAAGLVSPDGKLVVRTEADERLSGYSSEPVTRLVVSEVATGTMVVDMHLRTPGLSPVRFVAGRRVLLASDDGAQVECELPGATVPARTAGTEVLYFDYSTGRAGVVGMCAFGVAAALAAVCGVGAVVSGVGSAPLMAVFVVGFAGIAIFARTYTAHQELDPGRGEVRELRRWALRRRHRTWPIAAFDRVQHWRGLNRGAALFYLTLEGTQRCLLLPRSRDARGLLTDGERIANALGLPFRSEPILDRLNPPR